MNDLHTIDREAISRILDRRGFDFPTAARLSHINENTLRRLAGDYRPKGMTEERARPAQPQIIYRLARLCRVDPQYFAPDLPKDMPEKSPPRAPGVQGKTYAEAPGDWRQSWDSRNRRKSLLDLAAAEVTHA
jgi:hypothetical protein